MTATYHPGDLATLVTDEGVVVTTRDRLADLVALCERDLEAPTVVEVLSRGDLRALPDFAAVRLDGAEARILVRGSLLVRVDGFRADGRDATMWTEASATLSPGAAVEIVPVGAQPSGPALPLSGGVVCSAGLTWRPLGALTAPTAPAAPAPPPAPPAREDTVVRGAHRPTAPPAVSPATVSPATVSPAAVVPAGNAAPPPTGPPPPPPPAWQPLSGDSSTEHDGRTITPAQLQALRAASASQPTAPPPTSVPVRPVVGLALSTGRVVPVRRRVLIGRSPRIQQVGGSRNLPALVTLDDPYVSSTHLEVAAEDGRVTVTDMSTNGTLLARQGRVPVPLDRGVATEVAIGDVLTLSKGLTATVVPAPEEV